MERFKHQSLMSKTDLLTLRWRKGRPQTRSCKWLCGLLSTKPQRRTYKMGYKSKFTTPAENAMTHFSGWSGVNCETCKRGTTKAQLLYTLRVYDLYKCLSLGMKYHDDTLC